MTLRDSDFFAIMKGDQSAGEGHPGHHKVASITLGRWKDEIQRLNGGGSHHQRDFLLFNMAPPWCISLTDFYDPPATPIADRTYTPRAMDDLFLMEMQHRPVVYGGTPKRALTIERPTRVVWVTAGTLAARIGLEYSNEMMKQPDWEGQYPWAAALLPSFHDYFLVGRGSDPARKVTFKELYDYVADGLPHRS